MRTEFEPEVDGKLNQRWEYLCTVGIRVNMFPIGSIKARECWCRCIKISDLRDPGGAGVSISDAHESVVSYLSWHPADENLLLSTAIEPDMHLFDIRQPSQPLQSFSGHSSGRVSAIYQPAFTACGQAIVTGGQRSSQLSMYCPSSGRLGVL